MANRRGDGKLSDLQERLLASLKESGVTFDDLCSRFKPRGRDISTQTTFVFPSRTETAAEDRKDESPARNEHAEDGANQQRTKEQEGPVVTSHEETVLDDDGDDQVVLEKMMTTSPWIVSKEILAYMHKHNVPQKEAVSATGLNQSHLSQHLNKGTPMRKIKRRELYIWYLNKKRQVAETYKEYSTKRPLTSEDSDAPLFKKDPKSRFKWGSSSTAALCASYRKQQNPGKYERGILAAKCNRAELEFRGLDPNNIAALGGNIVTEMRVYNWFANRRKEEMFRRRNESIVQESTQLLLESSGSGEQSLTTDLSPTLNSATASYAFGGPGDAGGRSVIAASLPKSIVTTTKGVKRARITTNEDEQVDNAAKQQQQQQQNSLAPILNSMGLSQGVVGCAVTSQSGGSMLLNQIHPQFLPQLSSDQSTGLLPSSFMPLSTPWMLCPSPFVPAVSWQTTSNMAPATAVPGSSFLIPIAPISLPAVSNDSNAKETQYSSVAKEMHPATSPIVVSAASLSAMHSHKETTLLPPTKVPDNGKVVQVDGVNHATLTTLAKPDSSREAVTTLTTTGHIISSSSSHDVPAQSRVEELANQDVLGLCWSQAQAT